jgi:hypothetical protein
VNWKKIIGFAALLFTSGVLVGFIEGGYTGAEASAIRQQMGLGACLSIGLYVAIFAAMSYRQAHRPFLHALSAVLLLEVFSYALAAAFPAMLSGTPLALIILDWIILCVALVVGTVLGRHMAGMRRKARADA